MLKIKEDVDLKKLEKFGFQPITMYGVDGYAYDFRSYKVNNFSYMLIHCASREIIFDNISNEKDMKKGCELLYDLIKADMVEKVGE